MASVQDPVLGRRVGGHDAARVYDASPAGKNKVLQQRHAITDYLMEGLWGRALLPAPTESKSYLHL